MYRSLIRSFTWLSFAGATALAVPAMARPGDGAPPPGMIRTEFTMRAHVDGRADHQSESAQLRDPTVQAEKERFQRLNRETGLLKLNQQQLPFKTEYQMRASQGDRREESSPAAATPRTDASSAAAKNLPFNTATQLRVTIGDPNSDSDRSTEKGTTRRGQHRPLPDAKTQALMRAFLCADTGICGTGARDGSDDVEDKTD